MTILARFGVLLFALVLNGCASTLPSLISIDGSPTADLSQVAQVREDASDTALLRGLDGMPLKTLRIPSSFSHYVYVMRPGPHTFWVKGGLYWNPFIPQRLHCYVMQVDLAAGGRYLLKERERAGKALLLREDTGETITTVKMIDSPWIYSLRDCKWQ